MSTTKDKDGVINFFDAKKEKANKAAQAPITENDKLKEIEDMLEEGINIFNKTLEAGCSGFITIVFDEDTTPSVVVAGDLDPYKTLGVLDLCKHEVISGMIYNHRADSLEQILSSLELLPDDEELD